LKLAEFQGTQINIRIIYCLIFSFSSFLDGNVKRQSSFPKIKENEIFSKMRKRRPNKIKIDQELIDSVIPLIF